MCGIVGIRRFDGAPVDVAQVRRMANELGHRGPDDEGFLVRGSVGLGHRRLSIIDVASSAQPMSSPDGTLHVSFNGEILNYRELRWRTPYRYRTRGDTEILLSTFEQSGPASVNDLVGQFAYAMFSERDDTLWLFRDRLGILPLYYYSDGTVFVCASEIKAVIARMPVAPVLDEASLDAYLARRGVPAPWTLFEGIRKMPPGSYLALTGDGVLHNPVRYWSVGERDPERPAADRAVIDGLRQHLRGSVERNLIADVPVGAYLSGGLDSSLIVAMIRQIDAAREIRTYSAAFAGDGFDETPYARSVAEACRTDHTKVPVTEDDFVERWPMLTWHRDAPSPEASDVAVYLLAQAARLDGVKVDSERRGQRRGVRRITLGHRYAALTHRVGLIPARGFAPRAAAPPSVGWGLGGGGREPRYGRWPSQRRPPGSRDGCPLRGSNGGACLGTSRTTRARRRRGGRSAAHHASIRRRRMAHRQPSGTRRPDVHGRVGRTRPPFLDSALVEWAWNLPADVKVRRGVGKVDRAGGCAQPGTPSDHRPAEGRVSGPSTTGSGDRFAKHCRASPPLSDGSFVGNTLDRTFVTELLDRHLSGAANEGLRLWTLLSLEMWHGVFFGGMKPAVTLPVHATS